MYIIMIMTQNIILTMCITIYFLGPVASALTNRYGCRVVTIAGAIVAAIGFILSLFAPNIYYLFFSFGVLSGKTLFINI